MITEQPDPARSNQPVKASVARKMMNAYTKFIQSPGGTKTTQQIEFDKEILIKWLTSPALANADKIRVTFGFYDEEVSNELNLDDVRRNRPTVLFWPYQGNNPLPKPTAETEPSDPTQEKDPGDEEDSFNLGTLRP
jgi:hypothetical protein